MIISHIWTNIVNKVRTYPQDLFDKWYSSEFLDHFLQALYAKNKRYFPSRKRTGNAIAAFELKPQDCYARLLKIVSLGSNENTIDDSIEERQKLCKELKEL